MFGPPKSATKWLVARKLSEDNGINLEKNLAKYFHGEACSDIILNVYFRYVDAGVVRSVMAPEVKTSIQYKEMNLDLTELICIAETVPVPSWVFAIHRDVDEEIAIAINEAIDKIKELDSVSKKTLPALIRDGLVASKDEDFDELRILLK